MGLRPKVDLSHAKEVIAYIDKAYKSAGYKNTDIDRMISGSTAGRRKEPKPWSQCLNHGSDFSFTWNALDKILVNMDGMLLYQNLTEDDEILVESIADVPSIILFLKNMARENKDVVMYKRLSGYRKKHRTPYVSIFLETLVRMGYEFKGIINRGYEYEK